MKQMQPQRGRAWIRLGYLALATLIWLPVSISLQRYLPEPTGSFAVGRMSLRWVDESRAEVLTDVSNDFREVPVEIWYPAEAGTGNAMPYFPSLEQVSDGLSTSGEVSALEVLGLRFVKSHERFNASISREADPYPVILFSPGNGTNVEFYAGLAGELASHGYIVIGINHPYDVAAVALQNGSVAQFVSGPSEMQTRQTWVVERIAVRTTDALFVLGKLAEINLSDNILAQHLDLNHVAVMGHSLGGLTAVEVCRATFRLRACLNMDGLQIGGPFSANEPPQKVTPPNQPFMFITKETDLHPAIRALFESVPSGSYRLVVKHASHESFTDGPLLIPSFLPIPNQADQILTLIRKYALAFFDQTLKQRRGPLLEQSLQDEQIQLDLYPLP